MFRLTQSSERKFIQSSCTTSEKSNFRSMQSEEETKIPSLKIVRLTWTQQNSMMRGTCSLCFGPSWRWRGRLMEWLFISRKKGYRIMENSWKKNCKEIFKICCSSAAISFIAGLQGFWACSLWDGWGFGRSIQYPTNGTWKRRPLLSE